MSLPRAIRAAQHILRPVKVATPHASRLLGRQAKTSDTRLQVFHESRNGMGQMP